MIDRFFSPVVALVLSVGLFGTSVEAAGYFRGTRTGAKKRNQDYGVDCSFPIQNVDYKCDHLGDRKKLYEDYMQGCRDYYGEEAQICDLTETDRIAMNNYQPSSMINYTSTGYKKIRAPEEVMKLINEYWETNKQFQEKEHWPTGNIYHNHWAAPTYMVTVNETNLDQSKVWEGVQPVVETWTGMEQEPASLFGLRIYEEGAMMTPHVNRLPLVSSCIINVDQDVDQAWPLEVIDRQGKAVNITMKPGDMLMYESASLIHAHPFPLKGRYFANFFIHFAPTGRKLGDNSANYLDDLDDFFPPYIKADSVLAKHWKHRNPNGWKQKAPPATKKHPEIREPHIAAAHGNVGKLLEIADMNNSYLLTPDENGWHPLHEAIRSGHTEAAMFLITQGASINQSIGHNGDGKSPMSLALEYHNKTSPIIKYLTSMGAGHGHNKSGHRKEL